ncbi:MAG: molybdopterin dinucleotide binding domain-containing protein [Promethearchaeota archaeon]|jgi:formylmethanofuran dehydrogenase subunit D
MIVNTVRMVDYDQVKEYSFGDDNSLKENLAVGLLHPEDYEKLNLSPSMNLNLVNEYGHVIIKIKKEENIPLGTILMPVSIWANQITGISKDHIVFKNIKVKAEATTDKVLDLTDVLNIIKK